jgi:lysozyme family protein
MQESLEPDTLDAFGKAFSYTMDWEGWDKVTNDPDDKGGITKYGISKKAHPEVDVEHLHEDGAKAIYRHDYWDAIKGDSIKYELVAIKLFDMAVNMGSHKAVKLVQEAVNQISMEQVDVDGKMGPKTIQALNGIDPDVLFLFLVPLLELFYRSLNQPKFLKGWLRRARTCPKEA